MSGVFQHLKAYAGRIGGGSLAAVAVFGHLGLLLLAWALIGICRALIAVCRAFFEGSRPHVVTFGSDATAAFLRWLRRKCRLPPEA
jgi:hypothetical protein